MTKSYASLIASLCLVVLTGCGQTPAVVAPQATLAEAGASAAQAAGSGVTPAMITAFVKLLDANGDGVVTKNEGLVELHGPEKTGSALLSNYYDEKYEHGDQVKPLPVKTIADSLGKGYSLGICAIKGEKTEQGLYDTIGMSPAEVDRLTDGITDVLKQSPLAKGGLLSSMPVHHVVTPHYLFRKGTNAVEKWSFGKVRAAIGKQLRDKNAVVRMFPNGQHADGPFVLEIQEFPVF